MIEATDTPEAPWQIVLADDKHGAQLKPIRHLLEPAAQRLPRSLCNGCNSAPASLG